MPTAARTPRRRGEPTGPSLVPRERLLARLAQADQARIVIISAAAGWGKSVLLDQWLASGVGPVVRLPIVLDEPLWAGLSEACRAVGVTLDADRLAPLIAAPDQRAIVPHVAALFASMSPITLVLDGGQRIHGTPAAQAVHAMISAELGPVRLVITTRRDPTERLHRRRLAGDVFELRAADLAADRRETEAALRGLDLDPSPAEVASIHALTDGWLAGIVGYGQALHRHRQPVDTLFEASGIPEYLIGNVLSTLDRPTRAALVRLGCLPDPVPAELADALSGPTEGPRLSSVLDELARTGSFVVRDADTDNTFRFLTPMRMLLQREFARLDGRSQVAARRRAATWQAEHGQPVAALHQALAVSDLDWAADLMTRGAYRQLVVAGGGAGRLAVDPLIIEPARGPKADGRALVAAAAFNTLLGHPDAAARHLSGAAGLARREGTDRELELTARLVELTIAYAAGRWAEVWTMSDALVSDLRPLDRGETLLAATIRFRQAESGYFDAQGPEPVETRLAEALRLARAAGSVEIELAALQFEAFVEAEASHVRRATAGLTRSAGLARSSGSALTAYFYAATGLLALHRADTPALNAAVASALELRALASDPLRVCITLLRIWQLVALGDLAETTRLIKEFDGMVLPARLDSYVRLTAAQLAIRAGDPTQGLAAVQPDPVDDRRPAGSGADGEANSHDLWTALASARARIGLGEPLAAQAILDRLMRDDGPPLPRSALLTVFLLQATVSEMQGREADAVQRVAHAIDLADGEVLHPFLASARLLAPLLSRHPDIASRWPAPEPGAGWQDVDTSGPPAGIRLAEQGGGQSEPVLTARETSILQLLSARLETSAIADSLGVSVNTVKTHLSSIYRKLDVGNRKDAVGRARELELL